MQNNFFIIFYSKIYNKQLLDKFRLSLPTSEGVFVDVEQDINNLIVERSKNCIDVLVLNLLNCALDTQSLLRIENMFKKGLINKIFAIASESANLPSCFDVVVHNKFFCANQKQKLKLFFAEREEALQNILSNQRRKLSIYLFHNGFHPKHEGVRYIIDIIMFCVSNKISIVRNITNIYGNIAKFHGVSASTIEHNIRLSIKKAHLKNCFVHFKNQPTNKDFINYILTQFFDSLVSAQPATFEQSTNHNSNFASKVF